jgi:hypothetical protein
VLSENRHFGNATDPGCREPFALSADGETVYLHSGSGGVLTGYSEQEKFGAADPGTTLGQYLKSDGTRDFVALSVPTPGMANAAPVVGPVVITEIMYHPTGSDAAEYVELLNISDQAVTLYDAGRRGPWRFVSGDADQPVIELLFPPGEPVTLAAGEYLVLARDSAVVRARYNVPPSSRVLAWGAGDLSDGPDRVQLSRPGDRDADGTRHWIRVDRIDYSDGSHPQDFPTGVDPWPVKADGQGMSLTRQNPHAYGNDPANWQATAPSPGR